MEKNDNVEEVVEELKENGLPTDKFGKHNVFSRLLITAVIFVFIYVFTIPLTPEYAEIISYVLVIVFLAITFGINSLKILLEIIKVWKK